MAISLSDEVGAISIYLGMAAEGDNAKKVTVCNYRVVVQAVQNLQSHVTCCDVKTSRPFTGFYKHPMHLVVHGATF